MKVYDVVVVGSGAGALVAERALSTGSTVALIDRGPVGGTCLNVGCIPSKLLIYPADVITQIQNAHNLGITARVERVDFSGIMERMRAYVQEGQSHMREGMKTVEHLDFYETETHFVEDYTLDVGGEKLTGKKIFLASGARPLIPPIKGIEKVDYLTNETVLNLTENPESMVIIGGGYIACEYGHFFAAMGTEVTILQRAERLLPNEEPEISQVLKEEMGKRMKIFLTTEVEEVKRNGKITIVGRNTKTGEKTEYTAEKVLVASGRKSNADLLKAENTGVKTDERGYIIVNEYLETMKENIWAFGDVIGKEMFRHVANREADIAWHNSMGKDKIKMDYTASPHAIFSSPQVASVGLTEAEAKRNHTILVGTAHYSDVAKGIAMREEKAFVKAIVEKGTWQLLGYHIVGPHAAILIQEVVDAMAAGVSLGFLAQGMHIHPALSEVVLSAFGRLKERP